MQRMGKLSSPLDALALEESELETWLLDGVGPELWGGLKSNCESWEPQAPLPLASSPNVSSRAFLEAPLARSAPAHLAHPSGHQPLTLHGSSLNGTAQLASMGLGASGGSSSWHGAAVACGTLPGGAELPGLRPIRTPPHAHAAPGALRSAALMAPLQHGAGLGVQSLDWQAGRAMLPPPLEYGGGSVFSTPPFVERCAGTGSFSALLSPIDPWGAALARPALSFVDSLPPRRSGASSGAPHALPFQRSSMAATDAATAIGGGNSPVSESSFCGLGALRPTPQPVSLQLELNAAAATASCHTSAGCSQESMLQLDELLQLAERQLLLRTFDAPPQAPAAPAPATAYLEQPPGKVFRSLLLQQALATAATATTSGGLLDDGVSPLQSPFNCIAAAAHAPLAACTPQQQQQLDDSPVIRPTTARAPVGIWPISLVKQDPELITAAAPGAPGPLMATSSAMVVDESPGAAGRAAPSLPPADHQHTLPGGGKGPRRLPRPRPGRAASYCAGNASGASLAAGPAALRANSATDASGSDGGGGGVRPLGERAARGGAGSRLRSTPGAAAVVAAAAAAGHIADTGAATPQAELPATLLPALEHVCLTPPHEPASASNRAAAAAASARPGGLPAVSPGLQALAKRFKPRRGRMPKAMAALGPLVNVAKGAAVGALHLDDASLSKLAAVVETQLAAAEANEKVRFRERNRVAQRQFRARQKGTIETLQQQSEQQQELIERLREELVVAKRENKVLLGLGCSPAALPADGAGASSAASDPSDAAQKQLSASGGGGRSSAGEEGGAGHEGCAGAGDSSCYSDSQDSDGDEDMMQG